MPYRGVIIGLHHENTNRNFSEVSANADVKLCLRHSEVLCFAQSEVKFA